MADETALAQITAALQRADDEGYQRGVEQTKAELAGLDAAGLVCGAFADAMDSMSSRMVQIDAAFAGRLKEFAGELRRLAAPPEPQA